jgi:uncharacterized protein (UPF0332 family)
MKKEAQLLVDKGRRSIGAAKKLLESGYFDFAISRAYYAIFYLSEALLLERGKNFSKHAAVISAVYDEFIKSNELPKEFHRVLHRAFDLRQQSDYLGSISVTKDIAEKLIAEIEEQVSIAADFLTL